MIIKRYFSYNIIVMKLYYNCIKCDYITKNKSDMNKHINKAILCKSIYPENENITKEELLKICMIPIYNSTKKTEFICDDCNKYFSSPSNLNRHTKVYCKKVSTKNTNKKTTNFSININKVDKVDQVIQADKVIQVIQANQVNQVNHITQINNITINNLNIKINNPTPFSNDWNLDKMNEKEKQLIIYSNFVYTKFLEKILENPDNVNVVIKEQTAYVYDKNNDNNDIIKEMDVDDMFDKTMEKLYRHLIELNILCVGVHDHNALNSSRENIINKFKNYIEELDVKSIVNNLINKIYNEKKDEGINNFKKIELLDKNCIGY